LVLGADPVPNIEDEVKKQTKEALGIPPKDGGK
jgi:hypothetical protein